MSSKYPYKYLNFWNQSSSTYDDLVLGKNAPQEVQELEKVEDNFFDTVLNEHIEAYKETIFIEVGSGTGRYLKRCLLNVLTKEIYDRYLFHIVGIDFSMEMIKKSIKNINDYLPTLHEITGINIPKIKRKIKEKLFFINVNAIHNYLSIEGDLLVLVGVMFGTLGNIPIQYHNQLLSSIRKLVDHGGECIFTIFNAIEYEIGESSYSQMPELIGTELKWNQNDKVFYSTDKHFYSCWFNESEFKDLLLRNRFNEILEIHPMTSLKNVRARGIGVRCTTSQGKKGILNFRGKRKRLFLLCPYCSRNISTLPIYDKKSITCYSCFNTFQNEEVNGFNIPILMKEADYNF